jgi:hypothetical protein
VQRLLRAACCPPSGESCTNISFSQRGHSCAEGPGPHPSPIAPNLSTSSWSTVPPRFAELLPSATPPEDTSGRAPGGTLLNTDVARRLAANAMSRATTVLARCSCLKSARRLFWPRDVETNDGRIPRRGVACPRPAIALLGLRCLLIFYTILTTVRNILSMRTSPPAGGLCCGGLVRMLLPRTLCPAVCTRRSRPLEPWRLIPDVQILVLQPQPPCAVSFQHWHARLGRAGRLQSSTQEIRYPSSMEGHVPRLHCDHGQRHHAQRHSTARETALQRFLGRVVARRHLRRVSAARERNSSRPRVADA